MTIEKISSISYTCNVAQPYSYLTTSPKCSLLFEQTFLTSIVVKRNVTMLDIVSTRMLGQYGFLATVNSYSDAHVLIHGYHANFFAAYLFVL